MFPRGGLEHMHHLSICPNPRICTMEGLMCGTIQSRERERGTTSLQHNLRHKQDARVPSPPRYVCMIQHRLRCLESCCTNVTAPQSTTTSEVQGCRLGPKYFTLVSIIRQKNRVKRGGARNMARLRSNTETQEGMARTSTIRYFSVRRNHSLDVMGAAVPDRKRR